MKNTFGTAVSLTLFGESHGPAVGAVLDGLAPGLDVDEDYIARKMDLRRAAGAISTGRREPDEVEILSGVFNGKTTGTPLCLAIRNRAQNSGDYADNYGLARPGHADYTGFVKYHGFEDHRGGGHFSGRLTAPVVAAGAILTAALEKRGVAIGSHILRCGGVSDRPFSAAGTELTNDLRRLNAMDFAVLDPDAGAAMKAAILKAAEEKDSVGGVMETAVTGLPAGLGEPWFDSVESLLSHLLFSVPAVKGVEFGDGFGFADLKGSKANDPFVTENGTIRTKTNRNGGVNGGITNGMPLLFRTAVKPTPSIFRKQETVDFIKNENAEIEMKGRHDPAVIHRARVVVDSLTALALADLLTVRYGTDALRGD